MRFSVCKGCCVGVLTLTSSLSFSGSLSSRALKSWTLCSSPGVIEPAVILDLGLLAAGLALFCLGLGLSSGSLSSSWRLSSSTRRDAEPSRDKCRFWRWSELKEALPPDIAFLSLSVPYRTHGQQLHTRPWDVVTSNLNPRTPHSHTRKPTTPKVPSPRTVPNSAHVTNPPIPRRPRIFLFDFFLCVIFVT